MQHKFDYQEKNIDKKLLSNEILWWSLGDINVPIWFTIWWMTSLHKSYSILTNNAYLNIFSIDISSLWSFVSTANRVDWNVSQEKKCNIQIKQVDKMKISKIIEATSFL